MGAGVLLIVARGDAEWDQAATEPAADEAKNQAEDPGKSALVFGHVGDTSVTAMLALDGHWVVWPVARRVCAAGEVHATADHNHRCCHHRLTWLHHRLLHHRLTWLLHHGLTWLLHHGLTWLLHHGLTWLLHHGGSGGHGLLHHGLLTNKRLLLH